MAYHNYTDSNRPYNRVSRQSDHNDTIWNGAAWGAGAGAIATGMAYGAAVHGAKHLPDMNDWRVKRANTRMFNRAAQRRAKGKEVPSGSFLTEKAQMREFKADGLRGRMMGIQGAGEFMFGEGNGKLGRSAVTAATGLLGGMVIGAAVDQMN